MITILFFHIRQKFIKHHLDSTDNLWAWKDFNLQALFIPIFQRYEPNILPKKNLQKQHLPEFYHRSCQPYLCKIAIFLLGKILLRVKAGGGKSQCGVGRNLAFISWLFSTSHYQFLVWLSTFFLKKQRGLSKKNDPRSKRIQSDGIFESFFDNIVKFSFEGWGHTFHTLFLQASLENPKLGLLEKRLKELEMDLKEGGELVPCMWYFVEINFIFCLFK